MEQELFRKEVLQRRSERLWGELLLAQPLGIQLMIYGLALLVAGVLLFLALNSYTRKVSVQGQLVPGRGLISVVAPQRGLLQEVLVAPGERVAQGQPLFRLQLDHTLGAEGALTTSIDSSLREQQARLRTQLRLQEQALQLLASDGAARAALLHDSRQRLQAMLQREQELERIRRQALERAGFLHQRGQLAAADLEAVLVQSLQQEQARQDIELQLLQQETRLRELDSQQHAAQVQAQQQLQRLEAELQELEQRRLRLAAEQDTVQRAPVDGRVSAVHLRAGMQVAPDQPVLTLLPGDAVLQAELLLPGSAIGFVAAGQEVSLRLDAFPYQKFGQQRAWLEELMRSPEPLPPGEQVVPVYRAIARLERQSVQAFGSAQPLVAGMQFTADVTLDERSLLEWLLEPLFSIGGRP